MPPKLLPYYCHLFELVCVLPLDQVRYLSDSFIMAEQEKNGDADLDSDLASLNKELSAVSKQMRILEKKRTELEKKIKTLNERKKRMETEKLHSRNWEEEGEMQMLYFISQNYITWLCHLISFC